MTVELRPLSFKAEKSRARGDPFHIRADGTVLLKSPPHAWSQARMIGAGAMGETNDLSTPLPTCPGLTLADLAGHLGALYAWVAEIVRAQASQPVDGGPIRDEGSRRPRPRRHRGTAGSAAVRATNRRARWRAPRRRRRRVYRAWRRDQPHGVAHRLVPAHVHLVVGARATPRPRDMAVGRRRMGAQDAPPTCACPARRSSSTRGVRPDDGCACPADRRRRRAVGAVAGRFGAVKLTCTASTPINPSSRRPTKVSRPRPLRWRTARRRAERTRRAWPAARRACRARRSGRTPSPE
jgi:hypothetical protein